jgi:hypothetical protein
VTLAIPGLVRPDGTVGRGAYVAVGVVLFAVKHNLDRLVASAVFHRPWGLFNYLVPPEGGTPLTRLDPAALTFYATLVALALPFIAVGVVLTLGRLRDAGWPSGLVLLFFAPVLNLAFFLLLSLVPARPAPASVAPRSFLARVIPEGELGGAALALGVVVVLGLGGVALSVSALRQYGWGLFIGLPFAAGLAAAVLHGYHRPRSYWACIGVALVSVILLGAALLALAIEGFVCLWMAWPLLAVLAWMGGSVGYLIQRRSPRPLPAPAMLAALALFLPLLMGAERLDGPPAPLFAVRSAVEIDAPPEAVWARVVSFGELPEPDEWLFRLGVAYPRWAVLEGTGVGAVRRCVFSTGSFVEPITVWDAPRRLAFGVTAQPAPMEEWTPYRSVKPPHLEGYFVSEQGEFLLTPLPGGRTRLQGTTWYRHHMWPAGYWQLWSDAVIHRIHLRVLRHIKRLAESDGSAPGAPPNSSD